MYLQVRVGVRVKVRVKVRVRTCYGLQSVPAG
jgi:hypothetical protein